MDELREEYEMRDGYMTQNYSALSSLAKDIKELLENQPETLHGVLKQYKGTHCLNLISIGTTSFIKTLTNGIIFPEAVEVDISLEFPDYKKIREIIDTWEEEMDVTSTGLPDNVIDIINPLKGSKILPLKEQTDVILNVLPNFENAELGEL